MSRLPNDICRCAGGECGERDSCERFLQGNTGGPRTPRAYNLSDGKSPCPAKITAEKDADPRQRLRGHVASVNGSPAEYDDITGVVRWRRAIGSLDYDVRRHRGTWIDATTWQIDGKTIRFKPRSQDGE